MIVSIRLGVRLAAGAAAVALAAAIGIAVAPAAGAASAHTTSPHLLKPRSGHTATTAGTPLLDNAGPVQDAPRVYVDYWGWTSDPSGEQAYLNSFLSTVGGTSWLATVHQYGGGWQGGLLAGTWSDSASVPSAPTDAQIQAEAVRAANHFGTGTSYNVEVVVATPTGHSTSGFGSQWCAYHGAVGALANVTYTDLPYMTDAGASCGENSVRSPLDGVSIVEGHEMAETITDPLLNAWIDSSGAEIGDKCAWQNLSTITTSGGTFAVQPLWSNAIGGCAQSSGVGPTGPIVAGVSSSLCVDDNQSSRANGTKIQIYGCNGTGAQRWTVNSNGTLTDLGKCMDVNHSGTTNGTLVQLWDCNGTGAQQWQTGSNGSLVNPQSGKCLDDPGSTTTQGTQLQIYTCNGTNAQRWSIP
jgi:hypothetical protein